MSGGRQVKDGSFPPLALVGLLIILTLYTGNCKERGADLRVRYEFVEGIEHVTNTGEPLRGRTPLEVAEVLKIDPDEIDPDSPPLFQMAVKDPAGNLYLADIENVRIYKFDPHGKLVSQFLSKGKGPGEFPRFGDLQIVNGHAWVIGNWPMKIAKFSPAGEFVDEWKFPSFRNFYLLTLVVDEDRFLTVSYRHIPDGEGWDPRGDRSAAPF